MPYFKWSGVNLWGDKVGGRLFAWSATHLDEQLFKRKIALLASKPAYSWHLFTRVHITDKMGIFRQLFVLVTAGVLLPEALVIVAQQTHHEGLEEVMHVIALQVQEGQALSKVVQRYPFLCDSLMIQLLSVGEQSGTLSVALEAIVVYLQAKHDVNVHIRSALFVPGLTLAFFVLVVAFIFIFIIPRFADMFTSLGQDLPPLTKAMMSIGEFMTSWSFMWVLGGLVVIFVGLKMFQKSVHGVRVREWVAQKVPYVGNLVTCQLWGYFFESVGLLLAGGIQLVPALTAVQGTISHRMFYDDIGEVIEQVRQGSSFSSALAALDDQSVSPDIIAIVRVGQEVGSLDTMLKQVAIIYHNKVKKTLSFLTMIIQPLLIIMLGLLILLLIVAVYTPILNMSYAV